MTGVQTCALPILGIGILPQSIRAAIHELERDGLFHEQLGSDFLKEFIDLKQMEWVEYQRHVSDWEIQRYLEFY